MLTYISVEKYPLSKQELVDIYAHFPSLCDVSSLFLKHYPPCYPGTYSIRLDHGRVNIVLVWDDVCRLSERGEKADAWYLDGFAPEKNPDMWSEAFFALMGEKTRPGGTVATFSAAGLVKRGLRKNGFRVQRAKGFGRKWHCLRGYLKTITTT